MTGSPAKSEQRWLLRRGRLLETATLGWNVVGVFVLAAAAVEARSVALAGFGLDSLIEIGASTVVLWELADAAQHRRRRAMRKSGPPLSLLPSIWPSRARSCSSSAFDLTTVRSASRGPPSRHW